MSESGYWDAETGEELTDGDLESRYDDWLDELNGDVNIGSLSYPASTVLREVDPIAYRVGMSDFLSFEQEDGRITDEEPEDDEDDENDEDESEDR